MSHPSTLLAALGGMLFAVAAPAATRNWPGPAPCDSDFSSCLAGAQAGDTVRIVTSQIIADRIALERPVSIIAAPGVHATFTASQGHYLLVPGTQPFALTLRGLSFVNGSLAVGIGGSQAGELRFEELHFQGNAANAQQQLSWQLDPGTSGRSSIVVSRCEFEIGADNGAPFSVSHFGASSGGMRVLVEDNRFRPLPQALAQSFHRAWFGNVDGSGNWEMVFRRNRLSPAAGLPARRYASGFEVNTSGNVSVDLAMHDNLFLLDEVAGEGGAAISLGGPSGTIQARILNNTILHAYYATNFRPNVSGRFDNNLTAHGYRLHDGQAPASAFLRRANLEFGYSQSNWPAAPGTLSVDPLVSELGQPRPGSPLIDSGSDAARAEAGPGTLGVPAALDAQGLRRIEAAQVDIGAYEGERIHADGAE